MDILNNNDNDDVHMADSASNDDTDNSGEGDVGDNNNRDGDGIDHERLRALSNYADQNEDDATWYWNVMDNAQPGHILYPAYGWPAYRPLSNLSDLEREEIRQGETTRMVSHMDPQRYEGTGISLDWGEYYVADDEMSSNDEQSSLSSCEEAEEINDDDEELKEEEKQAHKSINDASKAPSEMNYDQLDSNVDASNPTLMGMPDTILEKILHYSTEKASAMCVLERVCKRVRRLTTSDDFWARHPASKIWARLYVNKSSGISQKVTVELPFTRIGALKREVLRNISRHQRCLTEHHGCYPNAILDVLEDEDDCVADTFRTLSANILSRMNHIGPEVHFRLRGDTIGYICELLQGYMIDRLQVAGMLPIHKLLGAAEDIGYAVKDDDIALAFQKDLFSPFFCGLSPERPRRCNISTGDHGQGSVLDCSCSLPSSSGIIWKWPSDNCHDILPPEAGRRIIRLLAYQAGIVRMSNDAFMLAEAELLHAMGILLVSAYESSVEMASKAQILGTEDELAYNEPTVSVDMFNTPPPPFHNEKLL